MAESSPEPPARQPVRVKAPSIRDVARLAGVSHQTVSRVLNNHPSIRSETKARVQKVMDDLQYRPNRAARVLATSRSRIIGVITAASSQYGPASSLQAIEQAAREKGYFVNTVNVDGSDRESLERGLNHLLDQSVEGLIVIAPQVLAFHMFAELKVSLPFVTLQSTGSNDEQALSVDQISGARRATRHLIEQGHRMIVHVAGPQDWFEAEARAQGFALEMAAAGLVAPAPVLGDWTALSGAALGRTLARQRAAVPPVERFTAIFSANDQMALGLIHGLAIEGVSVPGDVSIVGFDDMPEARFFLPPLTTIRQDFAELGRRSIALLLGDLDEESPEAGAIVPDLIVRGSTAAPRG
ncbi:LacI family DNA-binding transcriptional regulator [Subtercola sp. RTI3]|uniref:LacI family DNA-binding transcriptional regulator n=1 Tax=Subtercola sp. RTI3 TaxID=3048639 RepID=UPI003A599215